MKLTNRYGCIRYSLTFLLMLGSCLIYGQEHQQKEANEKDALKWGTLEIEALSPHGNWLSYTMKYEDFQDTLFLQHTKTKALRKFYQGTQPRFGDEQCFTYRIKDTLVVENLKIKTTLKFPNVLKHDVLQQGQKILTLGKDHTLQLWNTEKVLLKELSKVQNYVLNDAESIVMYVKKDSEKYEIGILHTKDNTSTRIDQAEVPISKMIWQKKGQALIYLKGTDLVHYDTATHKRSVLSASFLATKALKIADNFQSPLVVSYDGEKVFLSLSPLNGTAPSTETTVEVWKGNDRCLYPSQDFYNKTGPPLLYAWFPKTDKLTKLGDEQLFTARLNGLQEYVLLSNPFQYGLEPNYYEKVDYYIKEIQTGQQHLLLSYQSHDPNQLCFSPLSNDLVYYREGNWWLYKPGDASLINLTKSIPTAWDNHSTDVPHQFRVHGIAGWTEDGKYLLLYDTNDIWKVSLEGKSSKRITKGKEQQHIIRFSKNPQESLMYRGYQNDTRTVINLEEEQVLQIVNQENHATGYALYNQKKGYRIVDYSPNYLTNLKKTAFGQYVYTSENFGQAPVIQFVKSNKVKPTVLFESNAHLTKHVKSTATLLQYKKEDGQQLKSALFYPEHYDPTKQYPMIVNLYDKKSFQVNRHVNPTLQNETGYSIKNFTSRGYFVLHPDIVYELGNPGGSAYDCVLPAVQYMINSGKIDKNRIGIMGHSFGGFETDYIITQTNLFAAAVSGAGVADPISRYFGLGRSIIQKDEMWRYESQQFRMGTDFFSNKEGYLKNTPLQFADAISTPLLQWSGKEDSVVPYTQSIAFYMALRRLGKKTILLLYPEENHSLALPKNKEDLSRRIIDWFDYYLKNKKDIEWISTGTQ
ncbi:alpha/beta hydrolase family protein [Flavobacterium sp. SM2513]|uniref:alpha/beta hydrolase family protein n=1 Tax=Flavobacterium sp. SM2513 TaxID=3424766 RepID=UPI003D7F4166